MGLSNGFVHPLQRRANTRTTDPHKDPTQGPAGATVLVLTVSVKQGWDWTGEHQAIRSIQEDGQTAGTVPEQYSYAEGGPQGDQEHSKNCQCHMQKQLQQQTSGLGTQRQ